MMKFSKTELTLSVGVLVGLVIAKKFVRPVLAGAL